MYGSVLVVVIGIVAALLVLFHSSGGKPGITPTSPVPTSGTVVGGFAFTVRQVKAVPTGKTAGTQAAANLAAKHIERTIDALYFTGYLDPAAWQSGTYDSAWKLFSPGA